MQNLQLIYFVHATPPGQGRFHRPVKKLPSLQDLTSPSFRTWGRLQPYQLPGAPQRREGTTKPAFGVGQNKATPDSGHPPPQLCNTRSDWLFTQKLRSASRSQIRHVQLLPQTSLPVRQSAVAYPNANYGFPLVHTPPQHLWDTSRRSEEDENTHINWMSLKTAYSGIPKSPVSSYCRRRTAQRAAREASLWEGLRAAATSTDTSLSGFICYTHSATQRKLYGWATSVDPSFRLSTRQYLLAPLNTTGEVFAECEPPTLEKFAMALG